MITKCLSNTIPFNCIKRMSLEQLIDEENYQTLQENEKKIAKHVEHEVQKEDTNPETYLIYKISKCQNKTIGNIMFQILKKSCVEHSQYTWIEIMRILGKPMMLGAIISQNIKLLEHAMTHVDEIELERVLQNIDSPEIEKWYDENFIVT